MSPAELLQLGLGLVVGVVGWSLKRNIGDLDAKLSAIGLTLTGLTDHKAETREALVELRLRIGALEVGCRERHGRHQTGEHEVAR